MNDDTKQTKIEVYFTEESGLHDLRLDPEKIKLVEIRNGLLRIHDEVSRGWHCYNLNVVKHIHYPDHKI